jgi:hypothetical protein
MFAKSSKGCWGSLGSCGQPLKLLTAVGGPCTSHPCCAGVQTLRLLCRDCHVLCVRLQYDCFVPGVSRVARIISAKHSRAKQGTRARTVHGHSQREGYCSSNILLISSCRVRSLEEPRSRCKLGLRSEQPTSSSISLWCAHQYCLCGTLRSCRSQLRVLHSEMSELF